MNDTRYFILVGNEENWKTTLSDNIWGFSERTKGDWNRMNAGDFLSFYVTAPVKRIIGFGKVEEKFIGENLFWSDEKIFKKILFKYRFRFKIFYIIPNWTNGIEIPFSIMLNQGRKLINKRQFSILIDSAESKWNAKIRKKLFDS